MASSSTLPSSLEANIFSIAVTRLLNSTTLCFNSSGCRALDAAAFPRGARTENTPDIFIQAMRNGQKKHSPAMLQRLFRATQPEQAFFSSWEAEVVVCGGHTHSVPRDLHESQVCDQCVNAEVQLSHLGYLSSFRILRWFRWNSQASDI